MRRPSQRTIRRLPPQPQPQRRTRMLSQIRQWIRAIKIRGAATGGASARKPAKARRPYRPALECLETRTMPTFYFVNQAALTASDSGPGTADQPFRTIGAANARAVAGDTVTVSAGTYKERIAVKNSGIAGSPIVFTAAPKERVVISSLSNAFSITGKSYITIRGFLTRDTTSHAIAIGGSSNITIEANDIARAGKRLSGLTANGIWISGTTSSTILNNRSHDNSDSGIFVHTGSTGIKIIGNRAYDNARGFTRGASGIDIRSGTNTISRNRAYRNEDSGIDIVNDIGTTSATKNLVVNNVVYLNGDHSIDALRSKGNKIISNTVYGNVTAGINAEGESTGTIIENNISVDNGIDSPRSKGNIRVDATS